MNSRRGAQSAGSWTRAAVPQSPSILAARAVARQRATWPGCTSQSTVTFMRERVMLISVQQAHGTPLAHKLRKRLSCPRPEFGRSARSIMWWEGRRRDYRRPSRVARRSVVGAGRLCLGPRAGEGVRAPRRCAAAVAALWRVDFRRRMAARWALETRTRRGCRSAR
jgi:hypothetical protein